MLQISKIYSNEIEDRIDAPFYQEKYINTIRKIKSKGIMVDNLGKYINSVSNGVEIRRYVYSGTPYLRVSDMKSIVVSLSDVKYIKETINDISKNIKLKKDDVLISRSGTPGITSTVSMDILNSVISSHIIRVTTKKEYLHPHFLAVYLNSYPGRQQIDRITNGCLVKEISHGALDLIEIPILPMKEQNAIADLVENAKDKHIVSMKKIEEAQKIFEKTLAINHIDIKEEKCYKINSLDINDTLTPKYYYPKYLNTIKILSEKFKTIKLGSIASIKRGNEVGSRNYHKYIGGENTYVPFIRTSDLVNYEIDNYPDYYIEKEIYKTLDQKLRPEDIVYTKDGKIGLPAILTSEDKCILASGVVRIRINSKIINPYYVFLVLSTKIGYYQAMQRVVIAATLPHLQQDRLCEIEIPVVGPEIEDNISQLVKEAFKLKTEKKKLVKEALLCVEELLK